LACGGALVGAAAYQGVKWLAGGGLTQLASSFRRVFSSQPTTVAEAFDVGTTIGAAGYGLGAAGVLGKQAAVGIQAIARSGTAAGEAARSRAVAALIGQGTKVAAMPSGGVCFSPGVGVRTNVGLRPIESLAPGDVVWAAAK
jgi:hypothetical protein